MSNNLPDLRIGEIIPAFSLPGPDGMPHSPWDYKQREHLLLLVLPGVHGTETRGILRTFAREYQDFRAEKCALLVITPDPVIAELEAQEELRLPFPLLADPRGGTIERYTIWDHNTKEIKPLFVLADMYNALYKSWSVDQIAELPGIEEILGELRYLNKLCSI